MIRSLKELISKKIQPVNGTNPPEMTNSGTVVSKHGNFIPEHVESLNHPYHAQPSKYE